jgi:hypothetical protein
MMSDKKRDWRTAIHESGHFVVAWKMGARLHVVTIVPGQDYTAMVKHGPVITTNQYYGGVAWENAVLRLCRQIKISLAGAYAVKRAFPNSHWRNGADADLYTVGDMLDHIYPARSLKDANFKMQGHLLKLMVHETEIVLDRYWHAVEAIAEALLRHRTLSGKTGKQLILDANAQQVSKFQKE